MLRRSFQQATLALGGGIVGAAVAIAAVRGAVPHSATAQPQQAGELRATSFVLVGPEGAVLGQLGVGPQGNGELTLFDGSGTVPVVVVAGSGLITVGSLGAGSGGQVALVTGGPSAHGAVAAVVVSDSSGQQRISLGNTEATYGSAAYGVAAYTSEGQVIATFPAAP
jgi:hypothetical protein